LLPQQLPSLAPESEPSLSKPANHIRSVKQRSMGFACVPSWYANQILGMSALTLCWCAHVTKHSTWKRLTVHRAHSRHSP